MVDVVHSYDKRRKNLELCTNLMGTHRKVFEFYFGSEHMLSACVDLGISRVATELVRGR